MSINQNFPDVWPSLVLDFENSKTLDPRITFTRSSVGTYVASNGLIKTAAADEPRFDHDPETGESLGLLIEESRTNLLTYSENLTSGTGWSNVSQSSMTATNVSEENPGGGSTTTQITGGGLNSWWAKNFTASVSTTYQISLWVKVADGGADFNVDIKFYAPGATSGAIIYGTGFNVTSSWKRVTGYVTSSANFSGSFSRLIVLQLDNTRSFYAWGIQVEAGSFPTSYIPTSGSTLTRQPDIANITGSNFTNIFNTSEGTFVAECDRGNDGTEGNAIGAMRRSADTYYDMIQFGEFYDNAGFVGRIYAGNGSPQSAEASIGATHTTGQGIYNRYAFTYKTDDVAGAINGIIQGTDNSASLPTQLDRFLFGNYNDSRTNNNLDGHIKYLHYYPQRLTNAQLQNLTK